MKQAMKAAFPYTIPIMLGYLSIGIAFGLLFQTAGFNFIWTFFTSLFVYAGAMQFIAINLLTAGMGLLQIAIMTLLVNFRHLFYGLSFLDTFQRMGKAKGYMIFSLTDETYSLLCSLEPPARVDRNKFLLSISALNQCYWVVGSAVGALLGSFIHFDTTGMDFAMTALFVVIFLDQWKSYPTHIPALVGLGGTVGALALFGPENLAVPAMLVISALLLIFRKPVERRMQKNESKEDLTI